jgi:hypothetical protein
MPAVSPWADAVHNPNLFIAKRLTSRFESLGYAYGIASDIGFLAFKLALFDTDLDG